MTTKNTTKAGRVKRSPGKVPAADDDRAGQRTDAMLDALDELYGPVPPEVQAEVDAELAPFLTEPA